MEEGKENWCPDNLSSVYYFYAVFEGYLLHDFGMNRQTVLNILMYVNTICVALSFIFWHVMTFNEGENSVDTMFQTTVMFHTSCFISRIVIVFLYRDKITWIITLDYRCFNSSQRMPNTSQTALRGSYVNLRKLDKVMKITYLLFISTWYVMPALLSKPMMGLLTNRNGINEVLYALPSTLPSKETNAAMCLFRWVFHIVFCLAYTTIWPSLDLFFFGSTIILRKQYQILRNSLFHHIGNSPSIADPLELKLFVQDHVKLIRITNVLRGILSPIVAAQLLKTVFTVVCGTYMAASPMAKYGEHLRGHFLFYAILSIAEMYAFCWLAHAANIANQELGDGIYESSWYTSLDSSKRDWILPMLMSQKNIKYTAVGLVEINMLTFFSVLHACCSYYTLMKTSIMK